MKKLFVITLVLISVSCVKDHPDPVVQDTYCVDCNNPVTGNDYYDVFCGPEYEANVFMAAMKNDLNYTCTKEKQ